MDYSKFTKQELIKMLQVREREHVNTPKAILDLLKDEQTEEQECFVAFSVDSSLNVIKKHLITKGLVNKSLVHPREVFRKMIEDNATSFIIAHNHPSGNVQPSEEDREVTEILRKCGNLLGIKLLDHVIVGHGSFFSFAENGEIF